MRPERFDRFPVREAALCFVIMKKMNNESKKLMKPETETEAGDAGQRWVGKRVELGKGGQVAGKWTGLAHIATASTRLGPDNSTQVVDFPHLSVVRLFWEAMKWVATDETQIEHGFPTDRNGSEWNRQRQEAGLREITRTNYGLLPVVFGRV